MGKYAFLKLVKNEVRRALVMVKSAEQGQLDPEVALSYVKATAEFVSTFIQSQLVKGLESDSRPEKVARKGNTTNTVSANTETPKHTGKPARAV